jgi:hypothetical protein
VANPAINATHCMQQEGRSSAEYRDRGRWSLCRSLGNDGVVILSAHLGPGNGPRKGTGAPRAPYDYAKTATFETEVTSSPGKRSTYRGRSRPSWANLAPLRAKLEEQGREETGKPPALRAPVGAYRRLVVWPELYR